MCELMGMSANVPTDICFSFAGLMQRGGGTGPHADGFGIAFYEGMGFREFRDAAPSVTSEIAQLIKEYPIKSRIVVAHIRQANVGNVCLENTHPFFRELWGRMWTFAHNGQLDADLTFALPLGRYQAIGGTDSEHAFCWMLEQIHSRFDKPPDDPRAIADVVLECADQLRGFGVFNMLLTDSSRLYAYCSTKLHWITRRAPFGEAVLSDAQMCVNFSAMTSENDIVTVVATEPLTTNEQWTAMKSGELVVFDDGAKTGR
jgi:glutamine amidotransferase